MEAEVFKKKCRTCGKNKTCGGENSAFKITRRDATHVWYVPDCKDCLRFKKTGLNKRFKINRKAKSKICKTCGKRKPLKKFKYTKIAHDGYKHRYRECIDCMNLKKPKREKKYKICRTCGKRKQIKHFFKNFKRKDGTYNYKVDCKACSQPHRDEHDLKRRKEKKQQQLQEYLNTYEQKIHELFKE